MGKQHQPGMTNSVGTSIITSKGTYPIFNSNGILPNKNYYFILGSYDNIQYAYNLEDHKLHKDFFLCLSPNNSGTQTDDKPHPIIIDFTEIIQFMHLLFPEISIQNLKLNDFKMKLDGTIIVDCSKNKKPQPTFFLPDTLRDSWNNSHVEKIRKWSYISFNYMYNGNQNIINTIRDVKNNIWIP